MSKSQMSVDMLDRLAEQLAKDPSYVNELTPDELAQVRRHINPLGNVPAVSKKWANLSIINYKESWMRKFYIVAMTGYVFRLAEEYEPEEEIAAIRADYDKRVKALQAGQSNLPEAEDINLRQKIADIREAEEREVKLLIKTYRGFLMRFLSRHFEYNPDKHLRRMHTDAAGDPDRKDRAELIKARCKTAPAHKENDDKLRSRPDALYDYLRSNVLEVQQIARSLLEVTEASLRVATSAELTLPDKLGILSKKYTRLGEIVADMMEITEPISNAETLAAVTVQPPADLLHHFTRYTTNHFDALREITTAFTAEKPDVEFGVILYDTFKSEQDAAEHIRVNEKVFKLEPTTIDNTGMTLLGPFKENIARMKYLGHNTQYLQRMQEQIQQDQKLAADLVDKEVKKKKREDIALNGPDKPGLLQSSSVMCGARDMGAKKIISKEEMEKLEAEKRLQEDAEVPKDAIQVDMFETVEGEDGMPVMRRVVKYTQAEAPLFMQDDSPYKDQYQPKRNKGDPFVPDSAPKRKKKTVKKPTKIFTQ
jgi:hypothetical protein